MIRNGKLSSRLIQSLLFSCGISTALLCYAQECPPVPPVRETYSQQATTIAANALGGVVKSASTRTIRNGQIEILSRYPKADQLVINLTIISLVCQSMVQERLSPARFRGEMQSLRREILQPATTMRPAREPAIQPQYAAAAPDRNRASGPAAGTRAALAWATNFINSPPTVITDENRYFVVVASPSGEGESRRLMDSLIKRYPDASFALYPPYRGNPHYAVMAATWVSSAQAKLVKARGASMGLPKDMYVWRCPGNGNGC